MNQDKRLFSRDPSTGITRYFVYNDANTGRESDDSFTIQTEQDVTALVESNKRFYNEHTSLNRWGEMTRVANIPLSIYFKMKREGKIDDQSYLKRWLNDKDNVHFRTRPGKV